ncbi:MAG TPA: hypothetical protein VKY74_01000 [Chloroflexia bacterium]|nr:hypothetical protein [Chloroflexia bacterium]
MDDKNKATGGRPGADPREELRDQLQVMGKAAGELLEQLVRVPATLAAIPLQALPEDTATHARNAASEGFAAVRSLVDGISRGVDEMIKAQRERTNPAGGAGTGASTPTADAGAKLLDTTSSARDVETGATQHLGGHGAGAGSAGTGSQGSADSGSRDLGGEPSHTIRLEEEP